MRPAPVLTLLAVAAGSVGAVTAGPAASAGPSSTACGKSIVTQLATAKDPDDTTFAIQNGGAIDITCRDLNGDGRKDALFTVYGGGTGGAFSGGIVADDGNGPVLRAWVAGHPKTNAGFRKGLPAFAWPIYGKGDPDCCATGGWKVRRYRATGDAFHALRTQTLKSNAYPLKAKP